MKKRGRTNPSFTLIFGMVALFAALGVIYVLLQQQYPEPECYEETIGSYTIQEASDLLGEALVELTWLVDDAVITPQVSTRTLVSQSNPQLSGCDVTINYPVSEDMSIVIHSNDLGYIEATKVPQSCSWDFTIEGKPTGSSCDFALDGNTTTVRLNMRLSSSLSPETIVQIINGMRVVEPIPTQIDD